MDSVVISPNSTGNDEQCLLFLGQFFGILKVSTQRQFGLTLKTMDKIILDVSYYDIVTNPDILDERLLALEATPKKKSKSRGGKSRRKSEQFENSSFLNQQQDEDSKKCETEIDASESVASLRSTRMALDDSPPEARRGRKSRKGTQLTVKLTRAPAITLGSETTILNPNAPVNNSNSNSNSDATDNNVDSPSDNSVHCSLSQLSFSENCPDNKPELMYTISDSQTEMSYSPDVRRSDVAPQSEPSTPASRSTNSSPLVHRRTNNISQELKRSNSRDRPQRSPSREATVSSVSTNNSPVPKQVVRNKKISTTLKVVTPREMASDELLTGSEDKSPLAEILKNLNLLSQEELRVVIKEAKKRYTGCDGTDSEDLSGSSKNFRKSTSSPEISSVVSPAVLAAASAKTTPLPTAIISPSPSKTRLRRRASEAFLHQKLSPTVSPTVSQLSTSNQAEDDEQDDKMYVTIFRITLIAFSG